MLLSDLIPRLQQIFEEHGDMECDAVGEYQDKYDEYYQYAYEGPLTLKLYEFPEFKVLDFRAEEKA